jgi:hypothetical protein
MAAESEKPAGRPTKYDPKIHPQLVMWMCRAGSTMQQIADELGVTLSTVNLWQAKHKEFSDAIREYGRPYADWMVQEALFKRALGYDYTETYKTERPRITKKKVQKNSKTQTTTTEEEVIDSTLVIVKRDTAIRHMAADVKAIIFWLKNRKPDQWRDLIRGLESGDVDLVQASLELASKLAQGSGVNPASFQASNVPQSINDSGGESP